MSACSNRKCPGGANAFPATDIAMVNGRPVPQRICGACRMPWPGEDAPVTTAPAAPMPVAAPLAPSAPTSQPDVKRASHVAAAPVAGLPAAPDYVSLMRQELASLDDVVARVEARRELLRDLITKLDAAPAPVVTPAQLAN